MAKRLLLRRMATAICAHVAHMARADGQKRRSGLVCEAHEMEGEVLERVLRGKYLVPVAGRTQAMKLRVRPRRGARMACERLLRGS